MCVLIIQAAVLSSCYDRPDGAEIYMSGDRITVSRRDTCALTDAGAVDSSYMETGSSSPQTVYFTDGGSVYHTDPECPSFADSSEIHSGTVDYAEDNGKMRSCSRCGQ